MDYETIAAIATGSTNAGISIIRISGPNAIELCDSIFVSVRGKKLASVKSHTMHYGKIVYDGHPLDEVLVSVMKAPNTYTREDVVEINCHCGIIVTKKIFEAVIGAGARISESTASVVFSSSREKPSRETCSGSSRACSI